jgi:hypothetical protein
MSCLVVVDALAVVAGYALVDVVAVVVVAAVTPMPVMAAVVLVGLTLEHCNLFWNAFILATELSLTELFSN